MKYGTGTPNAMLVWRKACLFCSRTAEVGSSRCRAHGGKAKSTPSSLHHGADHAAIRAEMIGPDTRCSLCGLPASPFDPLELDHIVPASKGGTNTRDNYRPVHRSENRRRGNRET